LFVNQASFEGYLTREADIIKKVESTIDQTDGVRGLLIFGRFKGEN